MTTIDKIISYLTETSPQRQDANSIAEGISASVSTVRKNLKRMRDDNDSPLMHEKDGNSTVYWLAQDKPEQPADKPEQPAEVEPKVEADKPEQPAEVAAVPTFERSNEQHVSDGEGTIVVNTATQHDNAPRALMAKISARVEKHKRRMLDPKLSEHQRQRHRKKYVQRKRRLADLVAKHGPCN